ncbi:hypothetical protein [Bradyrhizobium sp.]|uniref:hypothetical protein n=1 Tax=Bradyrhizobium sp. TaxID=376 RepID=UPI0026300489|nr:hypothetical protein [Bradyrhizobium sp.]
MPQTSPDLSSGWPQHAQCSDVEGSAQPLSLRTPHKAEIVPDGRAAAVAVYFCGLALLYFKRRDLLFPVPPPKQFVRLRGGVHENLDDFGAIETAHHFIGRNIRRNNLL